MDARFQNKASNWNSAHYKITEDVLYLKALVRTINRIKVIKLYKKNLKVNIIIKSQVSSGICIWNKIFFK